MFAVQSVKQTADMTKLELTYHDHKWCMTLDKFWSTKYNLGYILNLATAAYSPNNTLFVTNWEHKSLPLFASQWHPEKAAYEFSTNLLGRKWDFIHRVEAIRL